MRFTPRRALLEDPSSGSTSFSSSESLWKRSSVEAELTVSASLASLTVLGASCWGNRRPLLPVGNAD